MIIQKETHKVNDNHYQQLQFCNKISIKNIHYLPNHVKRHRNKAIAYFQEKNIKSINIEQFY